MLVILFFVSLLTTLSFGNSKEMRLIERLNNSTTNSFLEKRNLVAASLVVATISVITTSTIGYSKSVGCPFLEPACDYATVEFQNYFCKYELQHVKHTTEDIIKNSPEQKISGGSKGTGGRYYGKTYANGVIRYWIDFRDIVPKYNWYTIDIFWCSDCTFCIKNGPTDTHKDTDCPDKDIFGMAIGYNDRYQQDIDTTLKCFKQAYKIKLGSKETLNSECNLSYDSGFSNIFEAGGSSYHEIKKTWDYGPGIKLSGFMDESDASTIDINVNKVLGDNTVKKCT